MEQISLTFSMGTRTSNNRTVGVAVIDLSPTGPGTRYAALAVKFISVKEMSESQTYHLVWAQSFGTTGSRMLCIAIGRRLHEQAPRLRVRFVHGLMYILCYTTWFSHCKIEINLLWQRLVRWPQTKRHPNFLYAAECSHSVRHRSPTWMTQTHTKHTSQHSSSLSWLNSTLRWA